MTIYFVAVNANILNAMGDRIYTDAGAARLVCDYWNAMVNAPRWHVYQATIAEIVVIDA